MCGEKSCQTGAASLALGSPPRMRGKGVKHRDGRVRVGITPAYAGKSTDGLESDWRTRDHPRVCGEKLEFACFEVFAYGITPAYAGKSGRPPQGPPPHQDHPRVCGEKGYNVVRRLRGIGSPPRMRGKDCITPLLSSGQGITPAYAGKSIFRPDCKAKRKDHPRVCGEKTKKIP